MALGWRWWRRPRELILEKEKSMMMLVPSAGSGDGSTTLLVSFFNLLPLLSLCFSFFLVFFSVLPRFFPSVFFCFFRFFPSLLSFFFLFPLFPSFLLSPSNSLFRVFFSVPLCPFSTFLVLFIEPRAWLFTALMGSSRLIGH